MLIARVRQIYYMLSMQQQPKLGPASVTLPPCNVLLLNKARLQGLQSNLNKNVRLPFKDHTP